MTSEAEVCVLNARTRNDGIEEHVVRLALHGVRVQQVPTRAFADAAGTRRQALHTHTSAQQSD